ncbi:MAG: PAS domain-containing sensor histidine kinase [Acidimicrobiales bacterium]
MSERGRDIFELAAGFAEESVIVTTAELDSPGPQIVYVNTAFTKMTGYSAAELIGQTPRLLQGPGTDRETLDSLRSQLEAGNDFVGRATNYRRDGTAFELEWVIIHVRNAEGQPTHFVAVQRDITGLELARSELAAIDAELVELGVRLLETVEELERAERQLRRDERMNALGTMARGVSHDLANSLTSMQWLLERIEDDDAISKETRQNVESLRTHVDHGLELHRHLSDFANASDQSEQVVVRIADLTRGIAELARSHRSDETDVSVALSADDRLEVLVDPIELRQVLVNLAVNAVDAMPEGGELRIDIRGVGDDVHIDVSDTGVGMSPAVIDRCFDPFFTTRHDGTGLSICHGLIEATGGTIDVVSTLGQGTTFTVRLPRAGV